MSEPDRFVDGVKLRIVQPNIAQDAKWRIDKSAEIFHTLATLSPTKSKHAPDGIADVTHLIWPESACRSIWQSAKTRAPGSRSPADGDLADRGCTCGATLAIDFHEPPASLQQHPSPRRRAKILAEYDKWRLVPGGEFLPFESFLALLGFRKVVTVPGSFAAGAGPVTLPVPGRRRWNADML